VQSHCNTDVDIDGDADGDADGDEKERSDNVFF
jgi:hypothetical protein